MPVVKAFVYFIVLKVAFEFLFRDGIGLVAAAIAAICLAGIEFLAIGVMTPTIMRHTARARYEGAPAFDLIKMTIAIQIIAAVVATAVIVAVVFAFSSDLWVSGFRPSRFNNRFWSGSTTVFGIVAAIMAVNYAVTIWAVSYRARQP